MKVVLASSNRGKLKELQSMLGTSRFECVAQSEFQVPDAIEDGLSFVENALKKARNASRYTGLPAIADDSGLEVEALKGAPGIRSARYAGETASDRDNVDKLLVDLGSTDPEQRKAHFICALVFIRHADDPVPLICVGEWAGQIMHAPSGENGFGYDPVFKPDGHECTAAELGADQKNAISHRASALACLKRKLENPAADF